MTPSTPKRCVNRGVGFDDGARIFEGPVVIWQDARRDYGEDPLSGRRRKPRRCSACGVYSAQRSSANNLGAASQSKGIEIWRLRE